MLIARGNWCRVGGAHVTGLSASTAFLPIFNYIFCRPEGLDSGRHSTINSCLKQNFLNFLCRTTVAQGAQHMSL